MKAPYSLQAIPQLSALEPSVHAYAVAAPPFRRSSFTIDTKVHPWGETRTHHAGQVAVSPKREREGARCVRIVEAVDDQHEHAKEGQAAGICGDDGKRQG